MSRPTIPQQFYTQLFEFLLSFKHRIGDIAAGYGLSNMQAITLLLTSNADQRSMNSFCKLYGCDASNMTGIVDGLEQKKLAIRSEHPNDRRIKVLTLLPKGEALKSQIMEQVTGMSGTVFEQLSDSELRCFIDVIQKLS